VITSFILIKSSVLHISAISFTNSKEIVGMIQQSQYMYSGIGVKSNFFLHFNGHQTQPFLPFFDN